MEERWAPEAQLKAYEDQVASSALPADQVGDVNKADLPGPEALNELGKFRLPGIGREQVLTAVGMAGKKPGEVKMIRKGATVEAHQVCISYFDQGSVWNVNESLSVG